MGMPRDGHLDLGARRCRTSLEASPVVSGRDQLAPREVAERTGFSYHAILRAIKRGDLIACEPIPGRLRIEVSEYERWRQQPTRAPATSQNAVAPRQPARPRRTSTQRFSDQLKAIEGGA
jgi:hypothetical protein